jgi:NAD(P)-dependent dehydrogenase (short-subunit alcohol dehydrogenase family)
MDIKNLLGYENEKCLVVGCSSGMGKVTAEILLNLGAEVYGFDIKEPSTPGIKFTQVDLKKPESIDAALSKLPSKLDKLFECAGIGGSPNRIDTVAINFLSHRYIVEKLAPRLPDNTGAIAWIASLGGMGWMMNMNNIGPFLEITDWNEALKWLEKNREDPQVIGGPPQAVRDYSYSKECAIVYCKTKAYQLSKRGVRFNTISPGTTRTPLSKDLSADMAKKITSQIGRLAEADEQAWPLVFLNSKLAGYISGADIVIDYAFSAGIMSGQVDMDVIQNIDNK